MEMVLSSGSESPNSFSASFSFTTTTRAAAFSSAAVKLRPG